MAVPTYDRFIGPLLLQLAKHPDGVSRMEVFGEVADAMGLPTEAREVLIRSGTPMYRNRIGWAHDRLKRAGLSSSAGWGIWKLTEAGNALAMQCRDQVPETEVQAILEADGDVSGNSNNDSDTSAIISERMALLYPHAGERHVCLEFFADVVEKAHKFGSGVWEVTSQKRRVRLNVGMMLSVELSVGRLGLGLVPSKLQDDLGSFLEGVGEWSSAFKTDPVCRFYRLPVASFAAESERITKAFDEFLQIAGGSARQTPYASSHSPAFVDYLEDAVARKLPRPEYADRKLVSVKPSNFVPARAIAMVGERALFKRVDYELSTLLAYIDMGDIGLPDIQRPFVWSATKIRDLLDSMFRGFPIGYLLLWENSEGDDRRTIGIGEKSRKVPARLIVDGQQRLTSLYAVIKGKKILDDEYRASTIEIAFRPRDGRFEVTDAAIRKDPEWIPDISTLWASGKSVHRIVGDFLKKLAERRTLDPADEDAMSHNIDRLCDLQKFPFTALEILPNIDEESVADIFVRINSEGIKLNQADFILTMLSVFWDEGRSELERFVRAAREGATENKPTPFNHLIRPSADQLLRVAVAVGFHRAKLRSVYQILRGKDPATEEYVTERREAQFECLRAAQAKVLDLTHWHSFLNAVAGAGFRSEEMITSQIALLYSYAFYLIGRIQCRTDDFELRRLIGRWFFHASLTGRYTNSSESVMDGDLARLRDCRTPEEFSGSLERIMANSLTSDFWSITLPNLLETSSGRSPAIFAYYAAQVRLGAPVLFSDRRVGELLDPSMRSVRKAVERHHLFPRKWLEKNGYADHRVVNQAANYALLEWPDNVKVSDSAPRTYVEALKGRFSTVDWEHMLSMHALPVNWERLDYPVFLEQRRKLMSAIILRGYESLLGEHTGFDTPSDASRLERDVWQLVRMVETSLRALVLARYRDRWGEGADKEFRRMLGEDGWAGVMRNREKRHKQYPLSYFDADGDVLEYCYLGQLCQFIWSNSAWSMFANRFRDKRQLEDLSKAIMPVRNDQAHFRRVPERELTRCKLACEDLLEIIRQEELHSTTELEPQGL